MACSLPHTDSEEKAMDEKAREEKIRQKQADDDEFFMEFGMVRYDLEYESSDEYVTEGFLTKKEQQQLAQDEEAYREYLEEEANAEKERVRAEKE
ncbi:hypothetical protein Tco_1144946 [Tanacetum coccineum]